MEINKQLFEDVLSGRLRGTFITRNGKTIENAEKKLKKTNNLIYQYLIDSIGCITSDGFFYRTKDKSIYYMIL